MQTTASTGTAALQLPRWQIPTVLPTIYQAERTKIHRSGREGRAARILLAVWTVGSLAGLVLLGVGLIVTNAYWTGGGAVLTVVSVPLPVVNALVLPGWVVWVNPRRRAVMSTSPKGQPSGFWSIDGEALTFDLVVMKQMLGQFGQASYRPRSERHARAYEAGVKRIGARATPRDATNPLGWWDVRPEEPADRGSRQI